MIWRKITKRAPARSVNVILWGPGWLECDAGCRGDDGEIYTAETGSGFEPPPTHWMAMPEPPTARKGNPT